MRNRKLMLAVTVIYLTLLVLLHWRLRFSLEVLIFFGGGILGIYFLDLADRFFKISPSPFRTVLFQLILIPLIFFILTSSGSFFGAGLVLSTFFQTLLLQWDELSSEGKIDSWFKIIKKEFSQRTQQLYFAVMTGMFVILNLQFI